MIYLDNAATSFPKPRAVLDEVNRYIRHSCGNPGRSGHRLALRAAEAVYFAREEVAGLLSIKSPERVIVTSNATHALNLAIKALITHPCHVLTSDVEHNSVVRPLERLKREIGIDCSQFSLGGDLYANLSSAVRDNTEAIVCTLASNVTGARADISALSRFAAERGIKLILDASQLVGHEEINLVRTPCTAFCAPGHKGLFGLQGSGFVVFCEDSYGEGLLEGGSGYDSLSVTMPRVLPEKFEAGTLATPAIVSLGAGIEYVRKVGIDNISAKLDRLTTEAKDALSELRGVVVRGAENGILCFTVKGFPSSEIAAGLDGLGICVRAGLHCAPSAHKMLGTLKDGTVRASFSFHSSIADAKRLVNGVRKIIKST